ncbi:hypothetical protein L2223_10440, partial [Xanthomonas perforans]|uniref:hypothetical protein n=1 Tax=Xanthomonas perforans TaxID=442694 RepID=UPI001F39D641
MELFNSTCLTPNPMLLLPRKRRSLEETRRLSANHYVPHFSRAAIHLSDDFAVRVRSKGDHDAIEGRA